MLAAPSSKSAAVPVVVVCTVVVVAIMFAHTHPRDTSQHFGRESDPAGPATAPNSRMRESWPSQGGFVNTTTGSSTKCTSSRLICSSLIVRTHIKIAAAAADSS